MNKKIYLLTKVFYTNKIVESKGHFTGFRQYVIRTAGKNWTVIIGTEKDGNVFVRDVDNDCWISLRKWLNE